MATVRSDVYVRCVASDFSVPASGALELQGSGLAAFLFLFCLLLVLFVVVVVILGGDMTANAHVLQVEAEASTNSNARPGFVPRQKPGLAIFGKSSNAPPAHPVRLPPIVPLLRMLRICMAAVATASYRPACCG